MNEILVFTSSISNRVKYSFDYFFGDVLSCKVSYTDDVELLKSTTNCAKITYGFQRVIDEILITPSGLLTENGVEQFELHFSSWNEIPCFFKVANDSIPFDPLSATFFLISRYEEYWPHKRDQHDRFPANESLLFANNNLQLPLVNMWAAELLKMLMDKYPEHIKDKRKFSIKPTVDVDNAYAFLEKGIVRTLGALARTTLTLNIKELKDRINAILGRMHDPFDTFDAILTTSKRHEVTPLFFFLLADYGLNDKNVPFTSRKFQSLIKHVNDYSEVGIHPSFASNFEEAKIKIEQARLSKIIHEPVIHSRQHFLKVKLPETYRRLIDAEIKKDYTMGYPEESGFRAGTCTPFHFFDLELNQKTPLEVHPFSVMEVTFRYYKMMSPEEAFNAMSKIINEVKRVRGEFSFLWHNDSLSDYGDWKGWNNLFEEVIVEAKK